MLRFKLALSGAVFCLAGLSLPVLAAPPYDPAVIPGIGPDPRALPARQAMPAQRAPAAGRYGGGFIEFMMTGATGQAAAPPARMGARRSFASASVGGEAEDAFAAVYAPQASDAGPQPAYGAPRPAAAVPVPGYEAPRKAVDPRFVRQEVEFEGRQAPGTIVIDTAAKFLYLVEGGGRAMRYGIGVGRPGFLWSGEKSISRKAEWPDWTPPAEMLQRRPDLPLHMSGGIANPLGARAMYLGSSLYRIHGTNEPDTIGTNVSSGCIRLTNDDVADLYGRVNVGTRVIVM